MVIGIEHRRGAPDAARLTVGNQRGMGFPVAAQDRRGQRRIGGLAQTRDQVFQEPGGRQRRIALQAARAPRRSVQCRCGTLPKSSAPAPRTPPPPP